LRRKLLLRKHERQLVDEVLNLLEGQGYLSDQRFLEEYILVRRRKGFGPVRIRAELQERGIADAVISSALDEDSQEWRDLMQQVAQRKFGDIPPSGSREQAKLARFLEQRGFSASSIGNLLCSSRLC
jgi:regulatory protein